MICSDNTVGHWQEEIRLTVDLALRAVWKHMQDK